ncbi:MAG: YlxR family protein [Clostridia bacterium]|nr:YlxR family protein [Clostridia bacterium]
MKKNRIPVRRCVGCGISYEENTLLRVVRLPDGNTEPDPSGKKPGRGAYICKNPDCLKTARKKKALERSLSSTISDEIYLWLENSIKDDLSGDKAH